MFSIIKKIFNKEKHDYDIMLGQLLIQNKILTENQLRDVLAVQRKRLQKYGKIFRIGKIIVELGFASEEALLKIINKHYNISSDSLDTDNIRRLIKEKRSKFFEKLYSPGIPIWLKLSLVSIFVIIPVFISVCYVMLAWEKNRFYNQAFEICKINLNYLVKNCRSPLNENNISLLNSFIKEAAVSKGFLYAFIVNRDNTIIAHSDPSKTGKTFINNDVEKIPKSNKITLLIYSSDSKKHILHLSCPITLKEKNIGFVHIGVSTQFSEQIISTERMSIFIIGILVSVLGIAMSALIGIHFSHPITKMVMATQKISEGDYNFRINLNRNDEFGNLAKAFNRMSEDLMKNQLMQKTFGKYVGHEVLEMILANPEESWIKGCKNEATIIFADIRGFTSYSTTKDTEEIVKGVNKFFEIAARVITDHEGYIDKFMGDAVLSVFGVPVHHKDHMQRALKAAVEIQKELIKASHTKKEYELLSSVGIGIDSGVVISGNIGSQIKMEYTVIGDCVNYASRLNALAGPGEIIISKKVYAQLSDRLVAEALPPVKIKGKPQKVETFKLLNIDDIVKKTKNS